jgi:hypothetical protein
MKIFLLFSLIFTLTTLTIFEKLRSLKNFFLLLFVLLNICPMASTSDH